jgi:hypothetical protein
VKSLHHPSSNSVDAFGADAVGFSGRAEERAGIVGPIAFGNGVVPLFRKRVSYAADPNSSVLETHRLLQLSIFEISENGGNVLDRPVRSANPPDETEGTVLQDPLLPCPPKSQG